MKHNKSLYILLFAVFALLPVLLRGAERGQFSNEYKQISYQGNTLYYRGEGTGFSGDGGGTIQPGSGKIYFSTNREYWKPPAKTCRNKSTTKCLSIAVDKSQYNKTKKTPENIRGELVKHYYTERLWGLISSWNSTKALEIEILPQDTAATGRKLSWDRASYRNSEDAKTARIIETNGNTRIIYSLNSSQLGFVFVSGNKAIQTSAFTTIPPPSGTAYAWDGQLTGDGTSVNITLPSSTPLNQNVSGKAFWGSDKAITIMGFEGTITAKLFEGNRAIKPATLTPDTGVFSFPNVPHGTYTVRIDQEIEGPLQQSIDDLWGYKNVTRIQGSSSEFTVDNFGVNGSADIVLSTPNQTKEDEIKASLFTDVLGEAINWYIKALNGAIKTVMGLVSIGIEESGQIMSIPGIKNVTQGTRDIALSVLTLGLLIIAFANIIGYDLNNYGLNRMIPRIVLAVVAVYFSLLISGVLLELATALSDLLLSGTSARTENMNLTITTIGNLAIDVGTGGVAQTLFIVLLFVALLIDAIWLLLLFWVRHGVLMFFVAIAPIAFMMSVMPFTQFLYKKWWQAFLKWVFLGPATAFFLYLGNEFLINGFYEEKFAQKIDVIDDKAWKFLILTAVCWGIAAFLPLKMGGEVFGQIKSMGKKAWGAAGGKELTRGMSAYSAGAKRKRVNEFLGTMRKKGGVVGAGAGLLSGTRGLNSTDFALAKSSFQDITKDMDKQQVEGRLAALGGESADLENPEVVALAEKAAKDFPTVGLSAATQGLLARAGIEAADIKDEDGNIVHNGNPKLKGIDSNLHGNSDKDTWTRLYNRSQGDADKGLKPIVGNEKLVTNAMIKATGKNPMESTKVDLQAIRSAIKAGNKDAELFHNRFMDMMDKVKTDPALANIYKGKVSGSNAKEHDAYYDKYSKADDYAI